MLRRCGAVALAAVVILGCGDDDARDADAGDGDAGDVDAGSVEVDAGRDGGPLDAGGEEDGGGDVDAGGDPDSGPADAGTGSDGGGADAGSDAGPPPMALFALLGPDLVRVDVTTGSTTMVGSTMLPSDVTRATYVPGTDTVYGIYDNPGSPKLATIDVCTGMATHVADITLPNNFVDGFEHYPDHGLVLAPVGADGACPSEGTSSEQKGHPPLTVQSHAREVRGDGWKTDFDGGGIF